MGEESKVTPVPAESGQDTLTRLSEIEKSVMEISTLRKKQLAINFGSVAVIIIITLAFVFNMYNYAREFNNHELVYELQNHAQDMVQSSEMQAFAANVQKAFLPAYKNALQTTLKAKLPEIRKAALDVTKNLETYLKTDIKAKLLSELTKEMNNFEKELVKRYPKLTAEQVHEVFTHAQDKFKALVVAHCDKRINNSLHEMAVLRESFNQFKNDPIYKQLKKDNLDYIKSSLIESMLELWIYSINPIRGDLPAGGAK